VTLPLHLLPSDALAGRGVGDVVVLDGPEGRHAATVRRTRVGEHLLLTDGAGLRVEAQVIAVGSGSLDLRVVSVTSDPEPSPRLVLVQALAKNDRDDQAIEAATECGVDEVVPWQASRCVVQWRGERGEKAWRKWDAVLVAATKQSRRTRRPVLAPAATSAQLGARIGAAAAAFVLHEDARMPLAGVTLPASASWSSSDRKAASRPRSSRPSRPPGESRSVSATACCARRARGRRPWPSSARCPLAVGSAA
jgi:16S rRNA (uracil1498-N3)-methyltransferase